MIRSTFLFVLLAAPAAASSPAAWSAHDRVARTACLRTAALAAATTSAPILFSDTSGKTALLVTGRYRQPHMKNRQGAMLCLYDRRTRRAEASDANGWRAPAR